MYASQNGHEQCALIEEGAAVDATEKNGAASLLLSCQNGHLACTKLLIDSQADVNLAM